VVEYRDVESHIDKLLAQLPADWREAFILSLREELPVEDIARNRGKSTERIEEDIESAKAFIREKLRDAGFMWRR
jgi:DNA-directed RNA polymerase specialized sigma24 family protein